MKKIRRHLSYANVMSSIAVFVLLGGAAVAAVELPRNSVGTKQLKKKAVKTSKIAKEAVKSAKVAKNAVTTDKIADGAVTTGKILNGAVTTDKIGNDAVTGAKVNEATLGQVPDAAKLGGLTGNELVRSSTATSTAAIDNFDSAAFADLISNQVTVPKDGILLIWAQVNVNRDVSAAEPALMNLRGAVDGAEATTETNLRATEGGTTDETGTVSGAVAVSAGQHTVSLQGQEVGPGLAFITERSVTTLFVPFGNSGVQGQLG